MKVRSEKIKRKLSLNKKGEVVINLDATDILSKEDLVEIYDGRIQEKVQLEDRLKQYKEQLEKVKDFENDEDIKDIAKLIEDNKEIAQKLFAVLQKKAVIEQIQVWEKALEGMKQELSDLGPIYKKLKDENKEAK